MVPGVMNICFSANLQKKGYVSVSEIRESLKWERERACHVLVSRLQRKCKAKLPREFRRRIFYRRKWLEEN